MPDQRNFSPRSMPDSIDIVCNQFEDSLREGKRPRIEDYLGETTGPDRATLFGELLAAEVAHRLDLGETPQRADYSARFPQDANVLSEVFARQVTKAAPQDFGEYIVLDKIGEGGMGAVYKARHKRMDRVVAIKLLPPKTLHSPDAVKRFEREVKAAAKLEHPNIVMAYDAGDADGKHFLVMQYVDGEDLAVVVKENGPLPVSDAVNVIVQAAKGLEYAHGKGIVHRDIKPANLLLDSEGAVKILDMGLARLESEPDENSATELTQSGSAMGTVDFMAPEQAQDAHTADVRSDIYSLGCTMYFLLTGRSVYSGTTVVNRILAHRDQPIPTLTDLRSDAPASLNNVFKKMVAKNPHQRQQSMSEVIEELNACGLVESSAATSLHSAMQATEPNDQQYDVDGKGKHAETVIATQDQIKESARPEQETVLSGVLDETITGVAVAAAKGSGKKINRRGLAIAVGSLLALLLAMGIYLKVRTSAGTIILDINQPELIGAVVTIDGNKKITIQTGEGTQPIEVTPDDKRHELKVTMAGFKTFTREFSFETGNKQSIKVRLDPLTAEVAPASKQYKYSHTWPKDQPPPAIAPFSTAEAKQYQKRWAEHLAMPEEMENSIGMKFRVIPPGEFLMGTSEKELTLELEQAKSRKYPDWITTAISNDCPQHKVTLTKPFGMSIQEVTRDQFRKFIESTGHKTDAERDGRGGFGYQGGKWIQSPECLWDRDLEFEKKKAANLPVFAANLPVFNVSANDATKFCEWLSKKEGVTYRLPTETEWEYACRAGNHGRFCCGDDESMLSDFAWYGSQGGARTRAGGEKLANAWGLYDMHGNVWEWCSDRLGPYNASQQNPVHLIDPVGSPGGSHPIVRGGSFNCTAALTRSALRFITDPGDRSDVYGFRIVRELKKPSSNKRNPES